MKLLVIITLVLSPLLQIGEFHQKESGIIMAKYNGGSEQGYYFTNMKTGEVVKFAVASVGVLQEFDLSSKEWIGEEFELTYKVDFKKDPSIQNMAEKEDVSYYKKIMLITELKLLDLEDEFDE